MTDTRALTDRLAIADAIRQVARAFHEKMHDTLLPQSFTAHAIIQYYLRGELVEVSMPGGIEAFKFCRDQPFLTARGDHA